MTFNLKAKYIIPEDLINEAYSYAELSKKYTSNRHDFHSGGLNNKQQKMFEGKLGEKIFKLFLLDNNIPFSEDDTNYDEEDNYDFILQDNTTIDVKTRTKSFHTRTLEMVEQFTDNPKDIYISVYLDINNFSGYIIGWTTKNEINRIHRIENQGYLDNYVLYDNELFNMKLFYDKYYS